MSVFSGLRWENDLNENSPDSRSIQNTMHLLLKNKVFIINKLNVIWTHPVSLSHTHVHAHRQFSQFFFSLSCALQTLSSAAGMLFPSSHSAECQVSTQPLIMVLASKRQLDSKCHPVLCQRRTRTHPAGRDRQDASQKHHPRKTLGTWMSTKHFRSGPATSENNQGVRKYVMRQEGGGVLSISFWPKPTLNIKCMRQIIHFMLLIYILFFLTKWCLISTSLCPKSYSYFSKKHQRPKKDGVWKSKSSLTFLFRLLLPIRFAFNVLMLIICGNVFVPSSGNRSGPTTAMEMDGCPGWANHSSSSPGHRG